MIIDLTHIIHPNMPVYPGTEQPVFHKGTSIEEDGFLEKKVSFFSHTGTHMDAPAHIIKKGNTLDNLEINHFCGEALCIDVKEEYVEKELLEKYEKDLKDVDFIILRSGWSKFWGEEKYFNDFPTLSKKAAFYLREFNLKGIGLDMISIDKIENESLPIHHIILSNNMVIIENLTNLENLPKRFKFYALPLKLQDADGAPIRAIGEIK